MNMLVKGLLSAAILTISCAGHSAVNVNVTQTEVPSKAPGFKQEIIKRNILGEEFKDIWLAKDIGNTPLNFTSRKNVLMEGSNWFGLSNKRVSAYLKQDRNARYMLERYVFRNAINNFEDLKPNTTVQDAIYEESKFDFLSSVWNTQQLRTLIADTDSPFVIYARATLKQVDFENLMIGINTSTGNSNMAIVDIIANRMVMRDLEQRGLI